jgi:tRNA pseudouridine65 synthase
MPLTILWQDDDFVAIHKPAGWLVHRTGLDAHETRFVMQTLRDQLGRHVYPVHRLDKGTSGVLLMALHTDAARALSQTFEAQQVDKRYIAMVRGWPLELSWQIDHALRQDDAPADAAPQSALTDFRRLATLQLDVPVDRYPSTRASLVEAIPYTGRRHQIRRHLKHISHPIIGDATHGKGSHNRWWAQHLGGQRLWLHALSLSITHPSTAQRMTFTSPLNPAATHAHLNHDWLSLLSTQPWQFDVPESERVELLGACVTEASLQR